MKITDNNRNPKYDLNLSKTHKYKSTENNLEIETHILIQILQISGKRIRRKNRERKTNQK